MGHNNANEFLFWSLEELSNAIREKQVSPVEITRKLLERIDSVDKKINSYITVAHEKALASAQHAEKEVLAGNIKGPLHGVPIGLKDIIYTREIKTTMGSEIYKDYLPDFNATVANKLEEAGATIIGKLNTHQFAYGPTGDRSYFGPVKNPHDPSKITGGSSSGSGAAVAAFLSYGALGTDTGGSVRIPSSMCGIVGMKPTFGRVSKFGVFPLSYTLDHVGPMTRTVKDNAILLNAISGFDKNDPYSIQTNVEDFTRYLTKGIEGAVIGIPTSYYFEHLEQDVEEQVKQAIKVFQRLGAKVVEVDLPRIVQISQALQTILRCDAYAVHFQRLQKYPDQWDLEVKERLLLGSEIKGYEYANALEYKHIAVKEYEEILNNVDVILAPTVPILPTNLDQREINLPGYEGQHVRAPITRLTGPTNLIGFPSLSVPCGFSSSGLPVGMQLIGKPLDEATLYRFGYAYEQEHTNQQNTEISRSLS
jgi:aspartyl-tRNA(Asn)/glutamyl-tRNA(Gln) amidotransferase subunit A